MSWHEFVFSEKKSHRLARHIAFWLAWALYLLATRYSPYGSFGKAVPSPRQPDQAEMLMVFLVQMLACYAFIYFLLPRYLLKRRYFTFLAGTILLGFLLVESSRLIIVDLIPYIKTTVLNTPPDAIQKTPYWTIFSVGLISGIKIIAAATAIRLGKHWWFKQKEKERLEKEKIEAELQLLKTQIHPQFLFNTLNNIYSFAMVASPKAPEMLLKLSDLLSYMLYECNDREVSLEKEIKMLNDYMSLEKTRYADKLEMNIQVKGDATGEKIAPLLLLRFIENSFKQCASTLTAQPWINLEIQIENHLLDMKLMNGKPLESLTPENGEEDDLEQVQKRLELLYPRRHELKITEEPEIMLVSLQIMLQPLQGGIEIFHHKKNSGLLKTPPILSET